jgi:hypothetical protein
MAFSRNRSGRLVPGIRLALAAGLALLVVLPAGAIGAPRSSATEAGTSAAPSASPAASSCQQSASSTFAAIVCWNGVNVNTAGSASSALSVDFSSSANVTFTWFTPTATPNPNDARLSMLYFGFALTTRDVVNSGTQNFADMSWTPGAIVYVLEGVFEITASILYSGNGTSLWSENFWVRANAPYLIFAALPLILIVIVIWELYSVARSGRQEALAQKQGKAPPEPAAEEPAPTETTAPPSSGEEAPPSGPEEPQ